MRFTRMLLAGLAGSALLSAPAWAAGSAPAAATKAKTTAAKTAPAAKPPEVQFSGDVPIRPELQAITGIRAWRVNGEEIPLSAVEQRALLFEGPYVLQDMVQEKLLLQAAKRQGIPAPTEQEIQNKMMEIREQQGVTADAAFSRYLEAHRITPAAFRSIATDYLYMERLLGSSVPVSESEIEQTYARLKDLYKQPAMVSYRAMTFPTEQAAEEALAQLRQNKGFLEVAKATASPEQKADAGELIDYVKGQNPGLTKNLEDMLFNAPLNQVTGPIKVDGGYALVRVEKKTDEHQFTLNEVRDRIRADLRRSKLEQVIWPNWINGQLAAAEITPVK